MLLYKVLVIKRNNLVIGHMFDFECEIKRKVLAGLLKQAQKEVAMEVQKRNKLFPIKKITKEELIKKRGITILPGDEVFVEKIGVEFGYGTVRFAPIEL
jgi:hypothetical protein